MSPVLHLLHSFRSNFNCTIKPTVLIKIVNTKLNNQLRLETENTHNSYALLFTIVFTQPTVHT